MKLETVPDNQNFGFQYDLEKNFFEHIKKASFYGAFFFWRERENCGSAMWLRF